VSSDPEEQWLINARKTAILCLGHEGRLISFSKSQYIDAFPTRIPCFNGVVCVRRASKLEAIWKGDLDITLDEPKLAELSRQTGQTIAVFSEGAAPDDDQSVFSVVPSGHSRFAVAYIERTREGLLQMRPDEPDKRPRWRSRVLWHRPRLLRVHKIERLTWTDHTPDQARGTLVYIGARDGASTPLLVLGLFRQCRVVGVEWTWYAAHSRDEPRHAPRPLLSLQPKVTLGRLQLWIVASAWPGFQYKLRAGWSVKARWR
jgi:hypothetical protein